MAGDGVAVGPERDRAVRGRVDDVANAHSIDGEERAATTGLDVGECQVAPWRYYAAAIDSNTEY
jgi:hypothetical protein